MRRAKGKRQGRPSSRNLVMSLLASSALVVSGCSHSGGGPSIRRSASSVACTAKTGAGKGSPEKAARTVIEGVVLGKGNPCDAVNPGKSISASQVELLRGMVAVQAVPHLSYLYTQNFATAGMMAIDLDSRELLTFPVAKGNRGWVVQELPVK